ncbi:hypothetical protein BXZ70DRAFT_498945 [Cristinia sonorae]|uniref:DUF6534 domain-containing protein n=1 Tax=Cristinia sonorae TaxID=1940300 RepID=A0A8K0XLC9_9AGAR|nr:hypothetical protein BXZ70DRAFT_498945 [Cristinia sonorae]
MSDLPPATTFMGGILLFIYATFPLYGIFIAQLFTYLSKAHGDSWYLKTNVALLTILETVHTGIMIHFVYHYSITSASSELLLLKIAWSAPLVTVCEMVMVLLVHSFYIRRIYIMSQGNRWLVGFLVTILVGRTVLGGFDTAFLLIEDSFVTFHSNPMVQYMLTTSLGLLAVADLCVASTMVYYLYSGRSGIRRTDLLVNTLIAYVVNSGFLTVILSFAVLLSFILQKQQLTFGGPLIMVTKLYANAVLGSLNMRTYLRNQPTTTTRNMAGTSEMIVFTTLFKSHGQGETTHLESSQDFRDTQAATQGHPDCSS